MLRYQVGSKLNKFFRRIDLDMRREISQQELKKVRCLECRTCASVGHCSPFARIEQLLRSADFDVNELELEHLFAMLDVSDSNTIT